MLDSVVHSCFLIDINIGREEWIKYKNNHDGRSIFQIDLALAVIEYGITHDWPSGFDEYDKPKWLRQKPYVACACGTCFFCKNGKTTGLQSKPTVGTPVAKKGKVCTTIREVLRSKKCEYCRECLRKRRLAYPDEKRTVARKMCKSIRLGY